MQRLGDRHVGRSAGHERENLLFAPRQAGGVRERGGAGAARRYPAAFFSRASECPCSRAGAEPVKRGHRLARSTVIAG